MDVVDARDRFFSWNNHQLEKLIERYDHHQQSAIRLIPFLFHVNHRLLPGYHSPDTLQGIFKYKPDSGILHEARKINNRFSYDEKSAQHKHVLDSVFIQSSVFDDHLTIWLVASPSLARKYQKDIEIKLSRVINWLKARDLEVSGYLLTEKHLNQEKLFRALKLGYSSATLFLSDFYAESFLMAGKYPVWWLLPPEKEATYSDYIDYLQQARFVNKNEYIDLGAISSISHDEIMGQSIQLAMQSHQQPESSWLKLLLLEKIQRDPVHPGTVALRLKNHIYNENENLQSVTPVEVYKNVLRELIDDVSNSLCAHEMPVYKLIAFLWKNIECQCWRIIMAIAGHSADDSGFHRTHYKDVVIYLNISSALFSEINYIYKIIYERYARHSNSDRFLVLARNVNLYLARGDNKIFISNYRESRDVVQSRVVLKHDVFNNQWILYFIEKDNRERKISVFHNLLSLIVWAWINRLVDNQTQISIDCPLKLIRQIEIRQALEYLIKEHEHKSMPVVSMQALERTAQPVYALLFINELVTDAFRNSIEDISVINKVVNNGIKESSLVTNCEQLIVNDWGELEVRQYTGNQGLLRCLSDWLQMAMVTTIVREPAPLKVFACAAGKSTYLAQRVDRLYADMVDYFFSRKQQGNFISYILSDYYLLKIDNNVLRTEKLGDEQALFDFLAQPRRGFVPFKLDSQTRSGMPINIIAGLNRPDIVQVFFKLNGQHVDSYVLDEHGALWFYQQLWYDRESYVIHWFLFMRNMRQRFEQLGRQGKASVGFEIQQITTNQLGMAEIHSVGTEMLKEKADFINVKVHLDSAARSMAELQLSCNGTVFKATSPGDDVFKACAESLKKQFLAFNRGFVFVTDIDIPFSFYGVAQAEDIQFIHFLRLKGNIEKRLVSLSAY